MSNIVIVVIALTVVEVSVSLFQKQEIRSLDVQKSERCPFQIKLNMFLLIIFFGILFVCFPAASRPVLGRLSKNPKAKATEKKRG
jgi:hypothetical protein